jgi:hypothetical protein
MKQIMQRSPVQSTAAFLNMSRSIFSLATPRLSYSPSEMKDRVTISTCDIPKR